MPIDTIKDCRYRFIHNLIICDLKEYYIFHPNITWIHLSDGCEKVRNKMRCLSLIYIYRN